MPMQPSAFTQKSPPSGIRAVFNRIAESTDVISFALGEPDFDTPPPLIEAACKAMREGRTHYTPNAGLYDLRAAIAALYPDTAPEQVVVTAGGTGAIHLTFMTLLNPGDEIIVGTPYWPTYLGQIHACGAVPRFVPTQEADGFALKAEQVERAITPKTKMLLINSPCNPTGAMLSPEDLRALAALAIKHDLLVLSDEVYRHIVYDSAFHSIASLPGMKDRCVIIDSFSKAYAMTGWRIGYVVAPPHISAIMTSMHEYTVSCIPAPTQMAALKALEAGAQYVTDMTAEFAQRRALIVQGIRDVERLSCVCPPAAFYLYFNISKTGLDSETFVYSLLEKEKVALAPGSAFGEGQESYVRLSFANSQEMLTEGARRIARFVRAL